MLYSVLCARRDGARRVASGPVSSSMRVDQGHRPTIVIATQYIVKLKDHGAPKTCAQLSLAMKYHVASVEKCHDVDTAGHL